MSAFGFYVFLTPLALNQIVRLQQFYSAFIEIIYLNVRCGYCRVKMPLRPNNNKMRKKQETCRGTNVFSIWLQMNRHSRNAHSTIACHLLLILYGVVQQ